MKFKYVVDNPKYIMATIQNYNPYIIKIKCICCSETSFMNYETPIETEDKLKIGKSSFPIKLIERITIRYRDELLGASEIQFKVSSQYFLQFLNDDAKESLLEFVK